MTNEQFIDTVRAMHASLLRSLAEANRETATPFDIDLRNLKRGVAAEAFAENIGALIDMLDKSNKTKN